jgi:hypothetical protein
MELLFPKTARMLASGGEAGRITSSTTSRGLVILYHDGLSACNWFIINVQ